MNQGLTTKKDPTPIVVTIAVGEKYELMAKRMAESCKRYTGFEVRTLGVYEMARHRVKRPHHLKFKLFNEFPDAETIFYIDADTIFLKPFDIGQYRNLREIVCVRDVWEMSWVKGDAKRLGMEAKDYFNSGFFIVNRTHHEKMLKLAEGLLGEVRSEFADQSQLNAARFRLKIPIRRLSREYNYLSFENCGAPETVTIGHLSGMGRRPLETITRYYQFWSRDLAPQSAAVKKAAQELTGRWCEYYRVGYDSRPMQFEAGGKIGKGRAGCEQQWEVSEHDGEVVLWLIGRGQPTCALTKSQHAGAWQGRWMKAEQMPVLVSRIGGEKDSAPREMGVKRRLRARNGRMRTV